MILKKSKSRFTFGGLIQFIGLLGLLFCLVNLFTKFHLDFSAWWIFGVSLVLYLVGMISGTTVELEISKTVSEAEDKGRFEGICY